MVLGRLVEQVARPLESRERVRELRPDLRDLDERRDDEPGEQCVHREITQRERSGEHGASAGVDRLLITHVPSWVDAEAQLEAARKAFPAAELARPGAVHEV